MTFLWVLLPKVVIQREKERKKMEKEKKNKKIELGL